MAPKPPTRWCAVYTRKSSEEGLDQAFNSLDAQREVGVAYVKSQQHEGWRLLNARYDDGGISGGTLDRPGLQRLLSDIKQNKVQTVVVYKVDRLTRSLSDFAKLIEIFEAHGVSFVSVTQQFNTTTSMGRLMLNVLLSFAQFEREVTGERIRDKIAASKKKGMWMGGTPALGYDVRDRKLIVNESEAELVRHIFRRYLELGTVAKLMAALITESHRTKRYTSTAGRTFGGLPFSRGHLYRILANRIYRGEIFHKGTSNPGQHDAIVDLELWDRVQALLAANHHAISTDERVAAPSLLNGLIFDDAGNRMSPSHAVKAEVRYRYYVSQAVVQNRHDEAGDRPRLPADGLERMIGDAVVTALAESPQSRVAALKLNKAPKRDRNVQLRRHIRRVVVAKHRIEIEVDPAPDAKNYDNTDGDKAQGDSEAIRIKLPFELVTRGGGAKIIMTTNAMPESDASTAALIKAVARGYRWRQLLMNGKVRSISEIAMRNGITKRYVSRLIRMSFLSPDIVEAILDERLPARVTLDTLPWTIPYDWAEQRKLFGLAPA